MQLKAHGAFQKSPGALLMFENAGRAPSGPADVTLPPLTNNHTQHRTGAVKF